MYENFTLAICQNNNNVMKTWSNKIKKKKKKKKKKQLNQRWGKKEGS